MNKSTLLYAGETRGWDVDAAWHDLVDPRDVAGLDPAEYAPPPGDPEASGQPADALAELEDAHARARVLVAAQYRAIADILAEAAVDPDPWTGPDPTLDGAWADPRGRTTSAVRRERRDLAVRAAVADIAVRLRMSETTVRAKAADADALRSRCPRLWALFLGGAISEQNARIAARDAASLPSAAHAAWAAFDEQLVSSAAVLTPARFRVRARVVRDRMHPASIDERHREAAQERSVWIVDGDDAMSTLCVQAPTADIHAAWNVVDAHARSLRAEPDEERTLAQLRADVLVGILARGESRGIDPVVSVTVPMMTLLGEDDTPATLDGYGPIDLDTAKRLAGSARSWIRVLTHPVTGTVLDVDRTTYRVPADLRRWVTIENASCLFPGCARSARECDIDHRVDWQFGGPTAATNLGPTCEHHHIVKHGTRWRLERDSEAGELRWTSPSGATTGLDPPPF
ncbi:MAG: DUF222 domain-containing protein [Microbacterium sp.]|uniref:HNH endonuclease signature motif containing protein n=1 Tax=Microbacterium sp. TaxID=51671 RepID=UPI0039E475B5